MISGSSTHIIIEQGNNYLTASPTLANSKYKKCNNIFHLKKYTTFRGQLLTKYLLPIICIGVIVTFYYFSIDYLTVLLLWIETQNVWLIFVIFILFFVIVSFPVAVGYLVLIITSGYLFGCAKGLGTVMIGANVSLFVHRFAYLFDVIKRFFICLYRLVPQYLNLLLIISNTNCQYKGEHDIDCVNVETFKNSSFRVLKNEIGKAILRVISGPRAFKVVLLARLTPIPFGLQNTIFGVRFFFRFFF